MGIKKFIKSVKDAFDIKVSKKEGKKGKIKELIKELRIKRKEIKEKLKEEKNKNEIENLEEDFQIIKLQIKKSKKILKNLNDS
jgi:predicted  nucleic acid-binding Zn-ribbon protein